MRQWFILYNKEHLEMVRSFKWIWVPLVFVLLGIMQPLSSYYLPELLEIMGGLPEGAVISFPVPSSGEVIVETFGQYGVIGILVLVLTTMGILSAERQSGVAGIIMVKPVPFFSYVSAKWAGALTLIVISLLLGMLAAGYYTEFLFGELQVMRLLLSTLLYSLWFVLIISITLFFSAMVRGMGAIAFLSLFTVIILTFMTSIFDWLMTWSPANIPYHAFAVMLTGEPNAGFWGGIVVTITLIIALVYVASAIFKQKELIQ